MNAPWLDGFTINLNQILIVDRWEPPKRELHNCGLCNKNSWFHPLTRLIEAVAPSARIPVVRVPTHE